MNQSNPVKFRRWPYHEILEKHNAEFQLKESCELIQDRNKQGAHLCLAILRGDNIAAGHMLKSGAPVNHQDQPDGWTPLIYSIYYNNPGGRKLLLSHGADIMVTDFSGRTVLMFAAQNGDAKLARQLIELGAPVNAVDKLGRRALDFAKACRNTECVALLSELYK